MIDLGNNRVAIMTNAIPADPFSDPSFTDPLNHVGDWKFHSALDYLGIVSVLTGTIDLNTKVGSSFPANGWAFGTDTNISTVVKTVTPHGQPYTPILMGFFTIDGFDVPITGDVFATGKGTLASGDTAFVLCNLYADATNINIVQASILNGYIGVTKTISYTVYVCNMGIDASGNLVRPPLNSGWNSSLTRVRCGRFDTNYGYFNTDPAGRLFVYRGKSIDIQVGRPVYIGSTYMGVGFAQQINGYVHGEAGTAESQDQDGHTFPGTNTGTNSIPRFTPTAVQISASLPAAIRGWDVASGRIRFGNVLDTDQRTFLITDFINISTSIPAKTVPSTNFLETTEIVDLGAVNPAASDVIGLHTIGGQWRSIGGSHVVRFSESRMINAALYQTNSGSAVSLPGSSTQFYLQIAGGHLQMVCEYRYPESGSSYTIKAVPIDIKAFVGTFDY